MMILRPYRRARSPLPSGLRVYQAAITDARREVPHGAEPAEWIRMQHRACTSWAERLAADWCRADRGLLTRWLTLQGAVQHAAAELARARQDEERCQGERMAQARLQPDQQNPMGESLSTGGYLAAMGLLTCLELPLVFLSFSAFGLSPINTGLLSLLSAVITAFLGHALGTVSRHMRVRAPIMLGILLLLSTGFAGSLAWLREGALEVIRSDNATLDPVAAASALFVISLASLAVASLLAWHHGVDPADRELHRARQARRRAERRLERLRRDLSQAETGRRAAREMARQDILAIGEAMLSSFHRYARWNQLRRDKHDLPLSLHDQHLPRLPMPAVLDEPLAWAPQEPTPS